MLLEQKEKQSSYYTQLVPRNAYQPLTVVQNAPQSLTTRNAERDQRRAEAAEHHYKTIWTRDPHSGEYSPVDQQLDVCEGDGGDRELGYEKVEVGPTTNFVGNHMTQAAIDLVQAELELTTSTSSLMLEEHEFRFPERVANRESHGTELSTNVGRMKGIDQYSWADCGHHIEVDINIQPQDIVSAFEALAFDVRLRTVDGVWSKLEMKHLANEIDEEKSLCLKLPKKVQIVLRKRQSDICWTELAARHYPQRPPKEDLKLLQDLRIQVLNQKRANIEPVKSSSLTRTADLRSNTEKRLTVSKQELRRAENLKHEGNRLLELGMYSEASALFQQAVDEAFPFVQLLCVRKRVDVDQMSKHSDVADGNTEECLGIALLYTTTFAELQHGLAKCLMQLGSLDCAIQSCDSALELWTNKNLKTIELEKEILLVRAKSLEALERYEEASMDYHTVLAKWQHNEYARNGIRRIRSFLLRCKSRRRESHQTENASFGVKFKTTE